MEQWVFFVAELKLLPTEVERWSRPVFTGMRPGWMFTPVDDVDYFDGELIIPSGRKVEPGETATIWIVPRTPRLWEHLAAGTSIAMCEGPRKIGEVTILERKLGDPYSEADRKADRG